MGELTVQEAPTPDQGAVKASKGAKQTKAKTKKKGG